MIHYDNEKITLSNVLYKKVLEYDKTLENEIPTKEEWLNRRKYYRDSYKYYIDVCMCHNKIIRKFLVDNPLFKYINFLYDNF